MAACFSGDFAGPTKCDPGRSTKHLCFTPLAMLQVFFGWLVLSDEQMSKRWQFSLLNDEQMSNWLGVKHLPVGENQVVFVAKHILNDTHTHTLLM